MNARLEPLTSAGQDAAPFVDRATALFGRLRERSRQAEAERRLHDETMADLTDAGFHRICQPVRFGGFGLGPDVAIEAVMAVARACGSAGWMTNIIATHNWQISMFPLQAQEEYWGASPDAICATAGFATAATVEPAVGGVRLSGRWKFASGADFAQWFMLMRQGEGASSWMLVPRESVTLFDEWRVSGLCATGSKDIGLEDVFVPAHRMLSLADLAAGTTPGAGLYGSPFYRVPFFAAAPLGLAAAVTGMGSGLVEAFQGDMAGKRVSQTGQAQSDRPANQILLAKAHADVDAARMMLRRAMAMLRAWGTTGYPDDAAAGTESHRNAAYAARLIVDMATRVGVAAGANAMFLSHPGQRMVRDILAGGSHAGLQFDSAMEAYGKARWTIAGAA